MTQQVETSGEAEIEEFLAKLYAFRATLPEREQLLVNGIVATAAGLEDRVPVAAKAGEAPPTDAEMAALNAKLSDFHDTLPTDACALLHDLLASEGPPTRGTDEVAGFGKNEGTTHDDAPFRWAVMGTNKGEIVALWKTCLSQGGVPEKVKAHGYPKTYRVVQCWDKKRN